jgi:hypothetical protein
MERNFTNENFERFLQKNADGLRMRPSDKVWRGLSRQLNKRRRRISLLLGISLLTATALGYYIIEHSSPTAGIVANQVSIKKSHPSVLQEANTTKTVPSDQPGQSIGIAELKSENNNIRTPGSSSTSKQLSDLNNEVAVATEHGQPSITTSEFTPTVVDSYLKNEVESAVSSNSLNIENTSRDPQTIESVVNLFKPGVNKKKIGWQIYFTPTVSYRKLGENKSYLRSVAPNSVPYYYPSFYNINSVVTHRPDFGFELGLAGKYSLTRTLNLRGGLQFNVNRYDIKVFNSYTQLATITLNTGNGIQSVNTASNYNNFSGYQSDWLQNFYFEVSAPVGVEFKVSGDDKKQLGLATTIQPTYLLSDRAYMISTDYKNYAEVPWLVRKWNVNTSLEAFVAYSTGHLKWQVGPQVRYQLLSSFINKYPVKENLFDFGLKVGISLNK